MISDPANPQIVGRLKLPVGTGTLLRVRAKGSYVYAKFLQQHVHRRHLQPRDSRAEVHVYPGRAGNTPTGIFDLQVVGSYAYLASNMTALVVVNIADPTQPTEVSRAGTGNSAYSLAVPPGGGYVYALAGFISASSGLQRWSLANPVAPVLQAINTTVVVGSSDSSS